MRASPSPDSGRIAETDPMAPVLWSTVSVDHTARPRIDSWMPGMGTP